MSRYESDVTEASISLWRSAGAAVRFVRRSLRWWLVILLLLAVAWLIADHHTAGLLRTEYAKLEAAGEPLSITELAPQIPPGEQNAAAGYLVAFDFLAEHDAFALDEARADPNFARAYLQPDETALRLLKEAAALDYSAFPTDWTQPAYSLTFPHFAPLRESARRLTLEAVMLAESDRPDDALDSIGATVRIGDHAAREPVLIATLVGIAIAGIGSTSLEEVLAVSAPSPAACRDLFDVLGAVDFNPSLRRALRAERAMHTDTFRRIRELGGEALGPAAWDYGESVVFHPVFLDLYRTVGRPLLNLDELALLEHMSREIELCDLSPLDRQTLYLNPDLEAQEFAGEWLPLTSMMMPVFSRAHMSVLRVQANLALGQVALAAKVYKAEHGRPPETWDEIVSLGWPLPDDPYTASPLHYRRNGNAFVVWSVGPNLIDDGGTEFDRQYMSEVDGPYDFVFNCDRERVKQERTEALQEIAAERQAEQERLRREQEELLHIQSSRTPGRRGGLAHPVRGAR